MAEVISDDFWNQPRSREPRIYLWDQWFDGTSWRLEYGPDFCCSMKSFQSAVYHAARSRGLRARTFKDYESLTVMVQAEVPAYAFADRAATVYGLLPAMTAPRGGIDYWGIEPRF